MELKIRRAVVEDSVAIAHVHVDSWRSTYAGIIPDAFLASLSIEERAAVWKDVIDSGGTAFFVAESGPGIFGFACGGKLRDAIDGYDSELYAIYLPREHQRFGAGRLLFQALADALRAEGFASLAVWVLEENPAVSFYRHLGGVLIARKSIEIGGTTLTELAYGWLALDTKF